MKRITLACALAALAPLGAAASATELHATYHFAITPDACIAEDTAVGRCVPWAGGLESLRHELHPVVPVRVARLLLPRGETLVLVKFTPGAVHRFDFEPEIASRQQPISLSYDPRPSVAAFAGGVYPAAWVGEPRVRDQRGFRVAEVPLYPLRIPGDGAADYVEDGELTLVTQPSEQKSELLRGQARDFEEAAVGVDNAPADLARDASAAQDSEGYLIIGPSALIGTVANSPLKPLIDDKTSRGLSVQMATLETVSPTNNPTEIRAFIKQKYLADGIDYVLLVGDKQRLPWKELVAGTGDSSEPIPSDQYYACLDGDFTVPSAYDWGAEVAVGRIGVSTRAQISAWVQKTLALQAATRAGRTRAALSFGEKMDESTLAGWALDYLISGHDVAPASVGFPAASTVTKLYDTFTHETSAAEFLSVLNAGDFQVVNHLGHANSTYVMKLNSTSIGSLRNRPAFFYSEGCYPNDPGVSNWTINAVSNPQFGPAAMISNTRYGWYEPGHTSEGTSAILHRNFWSMRFAQGIHQIGKMNHRAKAAVVAADPTALTIYTSLESNLIGDPELDLGI